MSKSVYFLSDAHLGGEEQSKEKIKEEAEYLYLVGDLFEFWFEYKNAIPRDHFRILTKLKELVDHGVKINYLVGNHDFWLGDFLPKHLNIPIFKDHLEVVHQGKRIFLSHGDGLAKKDWGYRILKKILRNRVNIFLYRQIPPDISYPLAKFVSRRSRNWVQMRDNDFLQEYENFAKSKIEQGYDAVILAHTHTPVFQNLGKGVYLNLGDWFLHFTYGKLYDGKFSLEKEL